ncbi:MAG: glycolate oxidase subunit GlcF [Pseudomonadales bacterium]|nr:glycolate oxidase subunit GlcF [Pseudomonadales bacterium]
MQTSLTNSSLSPADKAEADRILRSCVHCGFCLPTCPTYQVEKNELDSPRGRIYLMKEMFEGGPVTEKTQLHLDRCLSCQSCETTCPSGVDYHKLLTIGRKTIEKKVPRASGNQLARFALRWFLTKRNLFTFSLRLGQAFRWLMPTSMQTFIPQRQVELSWPVQKHERKMLIMQGCVQPGISPNTNQAAARVLDRLGIDLLRVNDNCCGALSFHLNAQEEGLAFAKRNIDKWWQHIESGVEAIVMSASGCGTFVKEYAEMLVDDPEYCDKAKRISEMTKDISEVLRDEKLEKLYIKAEQKIAFHNPCTLQHGQGLKETTENLLRRFGFDLTPVANSHICCGAAGTNSIFEPKIAGELRTDKISALEKGGAKLIATSNIGCQTHLQRGTKNPVKHWIEIVDESLL